MDNFEGLPISVRHCKVTFLKAGTLRNCSGKEIENMQRQDIRHHPTINRIEVKNRSAKKMLYGTYLVNERTDELGLKDVA